MDSYLDSRLVLLIAILGLIVILATLRIKALVDRIQEKKLEKTVRVLDTKIRQKWSRRDEELSRAQAEAAKKIAEEIADERKKEAEALSNLETKCVGFSESAENKFVERFVQKFDDEENEEELLKLQLLLKNRRWDFSLIESKLLVAKERHRQNLEGFKTKILEFETKGREGILEAYLGFCRADDEKMLAILADILKEKKLFDGTVTDLKTELSKAEEKIELDKFANLLLDDNKS